MARKNKKLNKLISKVKYFFCKKYIDFTNNLYMQLVKLLGYGAVAFALAISYWAKAQ